MNSSANWEQVKEVFSSVLEIEPERRSDFLHERCGDDDVLRLEVESWLASHAESEGFIEAPVFSATSVIGEPTTMSGRQFGNYRVIREIGHGGMGAVYLAERTDGEFEQEVALKIVRQSIAESQMIERFRRERQILATLNHPNIARLLDGGVSAEGEPFIAMEYVEGQTLLEYAAVNKLEIKDRLRLFLKVCSALLYAHRNLVVHRDIKPGNILVDRDGEPKLLDFGLAKLVDESFAADQLQTQTVIRAMTPAYASPEQLRGEQITTASDVYSLGVVFYELLSGTRPFQFEGKNLDEIIRTVASTDPSPPSSVTQAARNNSNLKGDLDNIALMALRSEPERRYRSVEAFAIDIDRYLNELPVSARPNTFRYTAGKFMRRNRLGVAAAVIVLITLIGGIAASLWQAHAAKREKERATKISAFLEDTLKYSNPFVSPLKKAGQDVTVNEALDEAARRLANGEFDNEPEIKADLSRTISATYFSQGKYVEARKMMAECVALLKGLYGEDDPRFVEGSVYWAGLLFAKGEMDESETVYRRYIPALRTEYQNGEAKPYLFADVLNNFAYLRRTQGDSREAEDAFRESLKIIENLSSEEQKLLASTRSTLASAIADQGRFEEALATSQEAVEEFRTRGETDSPNYGFALTINGGFLTEKGKFTEADAALAEAESIFRRMLAASNLWLGDNLRNQALSLYLQGKYNDSISKADAAEKIYLEQFGKHYDQYPTVLIAKGLSLAKTGNLRDGEKLLREAAALRNSTLPASHFWVAAANGALGECLALEGQYAEAESLLRSAYDSLSVSQESNSPRLHIARQRLGSLYRTMGRNDLAAQFQN